MKVKRLKSYMYGLVSCLIILAACTSEPKSNIESTPTKVPTQAQETSPTTTATTQANTSAVPASNPSANAAVAVGEKLYTENCKVCHNLNKVTLIGPGLAGINERRPQEWLIPWIKNSQKVIASGDKYAVELFTAYNKIPMPSYDFTNDQIQSILAYIAKNEQK